MRARVLVWCAALARGTGAGRIAAVLSLGLAGAACTQPSRALVQVDVAFDEPIVVPLLPNRLPVVAVTLSPDEDVPFIVDCGAEISVLDAAVAARLGLRTRPYEQPIQVHGVDGERSAITRCASVERLGVGALVLTHLHLPLLESDLLAAQEVGGILGQDLLRRVPFVVDHERAALHLLPPATDREGITTYLGSADLGAGDWLVAEADFRPCPYLTLDVEGLPTLSLEVDTGAGMMCLPQAVVDALALEPLGGGQAPGLSGSKTVHTFALKGFDLFGLRVNTEVQAVTDDVGLLGMDVLRKLVFVIDGPGGSIWLHRRTKRVDDAR